MLVAAVLILSLAGRELGIRDLLPDDERTVDDRDPSFSRLLAITLLPFLGMYAAFGQVTEAAYRLFVQQMRPLRRDPSDVPTVARRPERRWPPTTCGRLVALLVGLYVLRRAGRSACTTAPAGGCSGSLVVLIESFFLLVLILGGVPGAQTGSRCWLRGARLRAVAGDDQGRARRRSSRSSPSTCRRSWTGSPSSGQRPGLAALRRRAEPAAALAGRGRPGLRLAGALARRAVAQGPAVRRARARRQRLRPLRRQARPAPDRPTAPRCPAGRRPGPGRRSSATSTTSTCRPSTRSGWCCGPACCSSARTCWSTRWSLIAQNYFAVLVHWLDRRSRLHLLGRAGSRWSTCPAEVPFETLRLCLLAVAFRRCLELFAQRVEDPGRDPPPARPPNSRVGVALMVLRRSRLVRIAGGDRHGRAGGGRLAAERDRRELRGRVAASSASRVAVEDGHRDRRAVRVGTG